MKNTINFLYFLSNHSGMLGALTDCFGEVKGNHFADKLRAYMTHPTVVPFCAPEHIIKLLMEMSDDNKEKFLQWIDDNYKYKPDYKSE